MFAKKQGSSRFGAAGAIVAGLAFSASLFHAGAAAAAPSAHALAGNAAHGATVFAANCAICHGAAGLGGNGGPNLAAISSARSTQTVVHQVTNGGGGMPAFSGTLTRQQIADVAAYVIKHITHGK